MSAGLHEAFPSPSRGGARGGGTSDGPCGLFPPAAPPHPRPLPVEGGGDPSPIDMRRSHSPVLAHVRRLRFPPVAAASLLALAGLLLFGQGAYMNLKAILAQILLDRAFAETLASGTAVKPWRWADTWPVARIDVPRLGARRIALAGTSGQAMAFGPGHHEESVEPGEPGVAIFAAHRDTHFSFLGDVVPGDEIRVTRRDGHLARFRVTGTRIVRWDRSGIDPTRGGPQIALVTCWPLDAKVQGPMRFVVQGELIADQ